MMTTISLPGDLTSLAGLWQQAPAAACQKSRGHQGSVLLVVVVVVMLRVVLGCLLVLGVLHRMEPGVVVVVGLLLLMVRMGRR